MDVRLSPEQVALRDSVARAVDRLGVATVAALDDADRRAALEAAVAAAGWHELRSDAGAGRPWASGVETAIVAEELARGLADVAFLGPTLAADLRRHVGAAAGEAETVVLDRALAALATASAGALDHPGIAVDASGCTTGLAVTVDGAIGRVTLAGAEPDVDLTRPSVPVACGATVLELAGAGGVTDDDRTRWLALGTALTCADLVGVMRGAVALTTDYAAARRQYGVPVGSFQAVQHLLADARVATEGAASVTLHAAWAVDALPPGDALAAGAVAKAYAARAARSVCETAIQVHGGIGNTWDCVAHVYLRRALLSIDLFGGVGRSLARVLEHRGIGAGHGVR